MLSQNKYSISILLRRRSSESSHLGFLQMLSSVFKTLCLRDRRAIKIHLMLSSLIGELIHALHPSRGNKEIPGVLPTKVIELLWLEKQQCSSAVPYGRLKFSVSIIQHWC